MKKLRQKKTPTISEASKREAEPEPELEPEVEAELAPAVAAPEEEAQAAGEDGVTFESLGLCAELCEAVKRLGFKTPTPIQRESLPVALAGRDIIGLAQTGSGKTAAYSLPILQALLAEPRPSARALFACVLAPTRELAFQVAEHVEALGSTIGVRCATIVGGVDPMSQAIALAKRPHVVVGTPGRVAYHLASTKGFSLRSCRYLVFDEADRMLSLDFEQELESVLRAVPREGRRTFLYSATMTSKVQKLQRASLRDPVKVQVTTAKYETVATLQQSYLFVPYKYRDAYLVYALNEHAGASAIVFCAKRLAALRLSFMLRNLGFGAVPLTGSMAQAARLGALARFKGGERSVLVATDVAARGLDIPDVDLVVNYDVPPPREYVHRVGRTARAGNAGRALTLVTQYSVEDYQRVETALGSKLPLYPAEEPHVLVFLPRVLDAARLAAVQLKDAASGEKPLLSAGGGAAALEEGAGDDVSGARGVMESAAGAEDEDDLGLAHHVKKRKGAGFKDKRGGKRGRRR